MRSDRQHVSLDFVARSILIVAVTGEERGLLGSDYFAHYPTVPSNSIVANINLDMPLFLYPVADIIAFGSEHSSLEGTVGEAIERSGLAAEFPDLVVDPRAVGIFGRKVPLDHVLQPGDRVEIYRPLIADPREARRQRASKPADGPGGST